MADRICSCGKPIELGIGRPRKYCRDCRPPQDRTRNIACVISCQGCARDFKTTTKVQKFCSDRCRQDYWWTNADRIECSVCGRATGYRANRKNNPTSPKCGDCTKRAKPVRRVGECSEPGCAKLARSGNSGLCKTHYSRLRYSGTTSDSEQQCSVEACERKCLSRQMCPTHYSKWFCNQRKYTVLCPVCGKTAKVKKRQLKHCSYECSMKSVAAQRRGITIEDWLLVGPKPRTYRLTAIERAQRKLDKASKGKHGRTIWVDRSCKICGARFITNSSSSGRCCSEICIRRNKKEVLHRKLARRRAKKLDAFIEDVDRLEVFKRDKYICYLCNRKTYLHAKKTWHPRKATVDHVIPIAAGRENGGVHSYANCRTACQECNSAKSDRGGGEQLALSV